MHVHKIFVLCALVLLTAGVIGADVKVVQEHHQDGFSMMGQDQPATDETHVIRRTLRQFQAKVTYDVSGAPLGAASFFWCARQGAPTWRCESSKRQGEV